MADTMDEAVALNEAHTARSIAAVRAASAAIDPGQPGQCDGCGDDSPRLVKTAGALLCAPCRDRRDRRR